MKEEDAVEIRIEEDEWENPCEDCPLKGSMTCVPDCKCNQD